MHDYKLVLKCLLTQNGGIFEKTSLDFLVKFLHYFVKHLNPRVKVICHPCDIILTVLKEYYTTILYTKISWLWAFYFQRNKYFTFIRPRILNKWRPFCQDGLNMLWIFFSHNLNILCFYMIQNFDLCWYNKNLYIFLKDECSKC